MLMVNQLIGFGAGVSGGPITFVYHNYSTNSSTVSLSGTAAGDVVVCFSFSDAGLTVATPTGYLSLGSGAGGSDAGYNVSYKLLTGSDTEVSGLDAAADTAHIAMVFRNVSPVLPVATAAGEQSTGPNITPPAQEVSYANSVSVIFGALDDSLVVPSAYPSGYTLLGFPSNTYYQVGSSSNGGTMVAGYKTVAAAGTETPGAFAMGVSDGQAKATVILNPDVIPSLTGIQFLGTAGATKTGTADTTISLTSGLTGGLALPIQDGDLVIAVFAVAGVTDLTLSITDGTNPYTLIGSELYADDTYDVNLRVAYKFVNGDTSTTFGSTGHATDNGGATRVYVFRGVSQSTPLDVTVTTATGTNTILANPPSITPSTSGSVIVCIGAGAHNAGFGQNYSSSDLTSFYSSTYSTTNDITLGVGQKAWTSGAFDAAAFTWGGSDSTSFSWAAMSIALRPA